MTRRTLLLQKNSKFKKHPSKKHFFGGGGMGNFFFFSFSLGIYEYIYVVYIRYISLSFFRGYGGPFISFFLFLSFSLGRGEPKAYGHFSKIYLVASVVFVAVENLVSSAKKKPDRTIFFVFS